MYILEHCRGKEDAEPFQFQDLLGSKAQALMFGGKSTWGKGDLPKGGVTLSQGVAREVGIEDGGTNWV